jgi:hypothetical protein
MRRNFGNLSIVPNGLVAESVSSVGETIIVTARAEVGEAFCPVCGEVSRRVHGRYVRHVRDLPFSGQGVRLCLATRRFSCERRDCPRRIFAERFEETVLPLTVIKPPPLHPEIVRPGLPACLKLAGYHPQSDSSERSI